MAARLLAIILAVGLSTTAAMGHEFWIDPHGFQVPAGEDIVADIRVGQNFEGSAYSYFSRNIRRFEIGLGGETIPVEGREGDRPALTQRVGAGLAVIVHVTKDSRLTYSEFSKFEAFVRHKDAAWVLEAHAERGLPDTGFGEVYSRYAKSLVAVGDGVGRDKAFGLETELVAGLNPYTDDLAGGLPVTLLYQGKPRAEAQIEVFAKDAEGAVTVTTVRTDSRGLAIIPVTPGWRYMLDAVVLREPAPAVAERERAVWESLWANLTFAVPPLE